MRVEGRALGLPGDTPEFVAAMVRGFQPDTVPIVLRHRDGALLGYLDGLFSHGCDMIFVGDVEAADPDIESRLRDGIPVSIEVAVAGAATPTPVRPGAEAWLRSKAHWRGTLRDGWNLVGVALSDNPAAPGSFLRASTGTPEPADYFKRDAQSGRRVRWTDLGWLSENSGAVRAAKPETHFTDAVG